MIYRLLNNNSSYHFIALPLLAVLLWSGTLVNPVAHQFSIDVTHMMPLYQPFYLLMQWSGLAANGLAILLSIVAALLIVQMNHRFLFLDCRTFLPGYLYIIITGGFTPLHYLSPIYFVNIFGILAFSNIFSSATSKHPYSNVFTTGMILSIGSLFYFNMIFLFPLIWLAFLFVHKNLEWRHLLLPLLGILVPWLYVFTYYFFVDETTLFIEIIKTNFFVAEHRLFSNAYILTYLAILFVLTVAASVGLIKNLEKKGSVHRIFFQNFLAIGIMSAIVMLLVPSASKEMIMMMATSLSCILANFLLIIKKNFWKNALIYGLIFVSFYLQFV
ncbi:MAG: DUF6427 family protein [Mangrovibacterium sp.]